MENLINYSIIILIPLGFLVIKLLPQKNKKLPPSPLALPIIGHLHLIRQPLHLSLQNLLSRHGPILFLRLGARRLLVLSSPSAVEECFTKNDIVFANRPRTLAADHVTYNYNVFVVTPYGDLWRNLRRVLVVEVLSSLSLQKSAGVRETEARHILRRLFKASAEKTGEVDLKFLFNLFTVNINFALLTGNRGIEDDDEETEAAKLNEFKELFSPSLNLDLFDFFPVLRRIGFSRWKEQKLKDLQKRRDDYMNDLIRRARADRETWDGFGSPEKEGSLPLIHRLLALQDQDPDFYTDVAIKNMILTLFIAATETSAITLEWAMSLLFAHPKELTKAREEIETTITNTTTTNPRLLQDSDLTKLHHLRCVVNETLRLRPPAPLLLPHCASEDCTVGGYNVPRDTILMVNAWALHKDPAIWDEPDRFIPDRFRLEAAEEEGAKYMPFGIGRRACPGAAMGLRVVMLALGLMVQCFEWESIVGSQIEDFGKTQGVTFSKLKPLKAHCMPRQEFVKSLSQL